jgi:hypothetical protein
MEGLESLASIISSKAAEISKLLIKNSLQPPSFQERSYADFADANFADANSELRNARNCLINAAQDIMYLTQGPEDHILSLTWSVSQSAI